jgi:hypothetical protein
MSPLEREAALIEAVLHAGIGRGPRNGATPRRLAGSRLAVLNPLLIFAEFASHRTIFDSHLRWS